MKKLSACISIIGLLAVASAGATYAQDRTLGDRIDDAVITSTVKAKLVGERPRNLVSVNVDTHRGVVHLQGTVATEEQRMLAERLARATRGVVDVKNDLTLMTVPSDGSASPRTQ